MNRWIAVGSRGGFGDLERLLAADVVIVAPGGAGRAEGIEAAIDGYRRFMASTCVKRFEACDYIVTERGDAVVVEYRWEIAWKNADEANQAFGHEALDLSRREGEWHAM